MNQPALRTTLATSALLCLILFVPAAPRPENGYLPQQNVQPQNEAFAGEEAPQSFAGTPDGDNLWTFAENEARDSRLLREPADFDVKRDFFRVAMVNEYGVRSILFSVLGDLRTGRGAASPKSELTLPMPNGVVSRFTVEESPVMEPELQAQFPDIRTFRGQGIDDPTATLRCDFTPLGFHAQVISSQGTVYIDPFRAGERIRYITYEKRGLRRAAPFKCLLDEETAGQHRPAVNMTPGLYAYSNGTTLRTYRLALACTGEYATAVCNHNGVSVTVANTLAAMTTTLNRVNGVYERELAIHMNLVANETSLIFTNASTDPYTNDNASSLLSQNQSTCDSKIGSANYDIGHVFSTGGGGLAGLGVVCNASRKAQGETGSSTPYGDGYDIDYVAHEMGHEFGANHTFISTQGSCSGNGNSSTAYERGSGITIMAYAGICGTDDLAAHSYDYFHTVSLNEITNYLAGTSCAVSTTPGNTIPTLTIGSNYTNVPVSTPFTLTCQSATDANGDTLTYCWEDWQTGSNCKFRPWPLTTLSSRTFPRLEDLLSGASTPWETLPTAAGTRTFRCTVRDNHAGAGAYNSATMTVGFVAGAFALTAPTTAVSWPAGSSQTVTWTKGGSVSANVKISLTTDGGVNWTTLVASTANDGSETITVPSTPSTTCRIGVSPTDNVYFSLSPVNFSITGATVPAAPSGLSASAASTSQINLTWSDNSTNETGFKLERKTGSGGAWSQVATPGAGVTSYANTGLAASTTYYYRIRATNASGDSAYSNEANATTSTTPTPPAAPSGLTATAASSSQINLAWTDNASNETGFKLERKTGSGGAWSQVATPAAGATSYANTGLAASTTYYYRIRATNAAGDSAYSNEANATTGTTGNTIACGETKSGTLASGDAYSTVRTTSYADSYTFAGTSGQQVTIVMTKNGSTLDTWLVLKSPTGTTLAQNDDGNGGTDSKIVFTLTSTGTHTIEATSYYAGTSANGVGAYNLSLACGTVQELVLNGGFESQTTNWTFATYSSVTTGTPQAGTYKAQQLGRGTTSTTNFYQPIAGFNGTSKTLTFYLKIASSEGTTKAYDYLRVKIKNTSGADVTTLATYSNQNKNTYAGWTLVTLSIPASAAVANYRLSFDASEDVSYATTFYIDGVSVK
ncbi:MAG: fibronectin type III domain-containing protein [Acidobacteria bacterium]|nr:fibronectin type III domain-containing protein [Acidobacteriota bacterium]